MRHVDGRGWVGVRVMMLVQVVGRVGTDAATSGVICVICVICVCVWSALHVHCKDEGGVEVGLN